MKHGNKGLTFVEVIIAVGVFLIFALGAYSGYTAVYAAISAARFKALAADLANAEFEIIRNLPYTSIGIDGGSPSGVLEGEETVLRDNVTFVVYKYVQYVDDPFDGTAGAGDLIPNDYKLVEVQIDCPTCKNFNPVSFTGIIAPDNLESAYAPTESRMS